MPRLESKSKLLTTVLPVISGPGNAPLTALTCSPGVTLMEYFQGDNFQLTVYDELSDDNMLTTTTIVRPLL